MGKRVLVTGGAGFIGSHLTDELLRKGHRVRVLDNLSPQVHGPDANWPSYLDPRVEAVRGDVRDRAAVEAALKDVDVVYHLAAAVGVGQSMYEIEKYTSLNNMGTATLMQVLSERPVEKLIVASSMSLYGEGLYVDADGFETSRDRTISDLREGRWNPVDPQGRELRPIPTPEGKVPSLKSVYALGKFDQEQMCLILGEAYGIPTVALRFFNVYGPRQALSNPYTGVLAIFASRLMNGNAPSIFEDGYQRRDFVNVHDVARACVLAMERDTGSARVMNIGSGVSRTVRDVAEAVSRALGKNLPPLITGKYRMGDIRHCFADITRARAELGYEPRVSFEDGLQELIGWLQGQVAEDRVAEATIELQRRGLAI